MPEDEAPQGSAEITSVKRCIALFRFVSFCFRHAVFCVVQLVVVSIFLPEKATEAGTGGTISSREMINAQAELPRVRTKDKVLTLSAIAGLTAPK